VDAGEIDCEGGKIVRGRAGTPPQAEGGTRDRVTARAAMFMRSAQKSCSDGRNAERPTGGGGCARGVRVCRGGGASGPRR